MYPVDKKRVNEFGFGGEEKSEEGSDKLLEGAKESGVEESKAGEARSDGPKTGITQDQVSRTAAGIRNEKDTSSSSSSSELGGAGVKSKKDSKKRS